MSLAESENIKKKLLQKVLRIIENEDKNVRSIILPLFDIS